MAQAQVEVPQDILVQQESTALSPEHQLRALSPSPAPPAQTGPGSESDHYNNVREEGPVSLPNGSSQLEQECVAEFECNICLELAKEPVVTLCGHLYCWPCLYRWMQVQPYCKACPVCKAGVEVDKVVPIYGRGSDKHSLEAMKEQPVPPRPAGQRTAEPQPGHPPPGQPAPQPQQQQGVLPALFGFQLGPGQGYVEALTPEQQHQAFLARLLLMLGSFVIMCLLLF